MNRSFLFLLALGLVHCGGSVAADSSPTPAADTGVVTTPEPEPTWAETAACATVEASCTGKEAVVVTGKASGLAFLDGARVEFAVRYIKEEGRGLDVPRGVALGRTSVKAGAFSTCVCVPTGANLYPQIAAAVYRPHSTSLTSKDVVRATFSQRYATLGTEDVGYALNAVPTELQKAAAVAAMSDRVASIVIHGLGTYDGVTAGLVADERPLAAQVVTGGAKSGSATLAFHMPGRAYASERVAFFVDRNTNGKCDDGDVGGFAPSAPTIEVKTWLEGTALTPVCDALRPESSRE